jgi:hypothetical protein
MRIFEVALKFRRQEIGGRRQEAGGTHSFYSYFFPPARTALCLLPSL